MKKSSFVTMMLGTVSIVLFALGMCMALIPEWQAFMPGGDLRMRWSASWACHLDCMAKDGAQETDPPERKNGPDGPCRGCGRFGLGNRDVLHHGVG